MRQKNYVLIGHNRAATTGMVVRKNAHPFEFDGLVGVHNGTLTNKHEIPDSYHFDTDSEALYNQINKKGLEEAMKNIRGAYALVWYDKDEHTINFLRNNERPLSLIISEDKKCLFFASEPWMVTMLMMRTGYKNLGVEELPIDSHLSFKIPKDNEAFEKARVRAVKPIPFTIPPVTKEVVTTVGSTNITKLHSHKKEPDKAKVLALKPGTLIENLESLHWSKNSFGALFVRFCSEDHEGVPFKAFFDSIEECREYSECNDLFSARVSFVGYQDGELSVKLSPHSLIKQVPDLPDSKVDNRGMPITKDAFNKQYGVCVWCSSPTLYEEDWIPLSADTCLCANCSEDPEIKSYIPELKRIA